MGRFNDKGFARGDSTKFKLVVLTVVLLIGLGSGSTHAFELAIGNWFSDAPVATTVLPSSISAGDNSKSVPVEFEAGVQGERRMLAGYSAYISYGALTARHTPCPPRSGRSYYTPNCRSASGAVRPYRRGCSSISRCARG